MVEDMALVQKRAREFKRWENLASVGQALPPPASGAAHELTAWIQRNSGAIHKACHADTPKEEGEQTWKAFRKAIEQTLLQFCCHAQGLPLAVGSAAVRSFEHAFQSSMKLSPSKSTYHAANTSINADRASVASMRVPVSRGSWGKEGLSLPSIKSDVASVHSSDILAMPKDAIKTMLSGDKLDRHQRHVIHKAQDMQWQRLFDKKRDNIIKPQPPPPSPPHEHAHATARHSQRQLHVHGSIDAETREERDARRKAERDALRRARVEERKRQRAEREILEKIRSGVLNEKGQELAQVQAAESIAREQEAAFQARFEIKKQEQRTNAALVKKLRKLMQQRFTNTKTLPMDLFLAFKRFDVDRSGFIDFKEFFQVCVEVGLGGSILTKEEVKMLFNQCDTNSSGKVDFSEFLRVVVGNLTGI